MAKRTRLPVSVDQILSGFKTSPHAKENGVDIDAAKSTFSKSMVEYFSKMNEEVGDDEPVDELLIPSLVFPLSDLLGKALPREARALFDDDALNAQIQSAQARRVLVALKHQNHNELLRDLTIWAMVTGWPKKSERPEGKYRPLAEGFFLASGELSGAIPVQADGGSLVESIVSLCVAILLGHIGTADWQSVGVSG